MKQLFSKMKSSWRLVVSCIIAFLGLAFSSSTAKASDYTFYIDASYASWSDPQVYYFNGGTYGWATMSSDSGNIKKATITNAPSSITIIVAKSQNWGGQTYNWDDAQKCNGKLFTLNSYNSNDGKYGMSDSDYTPSSYSYLIDYQTDPKSDGSERNGSWTTSSSQNINASSSKTFTVSLKQGAHFGVKTGETFYGPSSGDVKINGSQTITSVNGNSGNHFIWMGKDGNVSITVTLNSSGAVSSVAVSGTASTGGSTQTGPTPNSSKVQIKGDFLGNNWALVNTYERNAKEYFYTFNATSTDNYFFGISVDGTVYEPTKTTWDNNCQVEYDINWDEAKTQKGDNRRWYRWLTQGKTYTIWISLEYADGPRVVLYDGVPTYHTYTNNPDKKGHVYLLASQLNNRQESPEWRMEKTGTNTYTLKNFAMRSSAVGDVPIVSWYDATTGTRYSQSFPNAAIPTSSDNWMQPGWAYTATVTINGTSASLTMKPVSTSSYQSVSQDLLPYIGILGQNFKQAHPKNSSTGYTTPNTGTNMGNTDNGWQEAYIQYDDAGNIVRDENGNVYYNTYWPPRNNMRMISDIGDGSPLPITSHSTTFKLDTENLAKTGSEWATILNKATDPAYANLNLNSTQKYYRYVIKDIWMLGTYKIWTGWSGLSTTWGANWNHHLYWGPQDGDKTTAAGTMYYPKNDVNSNNFNIDKKSYFNTMEFFVPVTADASGERAKTVDINNPILYLTKSYASIDAMTKKVNNADHAGYAPKLENWLEGYDHIKTYTITRYAYDSNAEEGNYLPCDKNGETDIDIADAQIKPNVSDVNFKTNDDFNKSFQKSSSFSDNYVDDGIYAPGLYIYSLDIEFVKNDGASKTITVWSPYIEIIDENYTLKIESAQLIQLPTQDDLRNAPQADQNIIFEGFTHATYNTANNPLLVNIENGVVTDVERASNVEGFTTAKYIKIKEKYGKWTNDVLMRTAEPSTFLAQAKTKNVSTFNIKRKGTQIKDLRTAEKIGSYYYVVDKSNGTSLDKVNYSVSYSATGTSFSNVALTANPTDDEVTYTPTFMQPRFDKKNSKLYFDTEGDETHSFTASHPDLNYNDPEDKTDSNTKQQKGIKTNRHELRADVVLVMPNIATEELKEAVVNNLDLTFTKDGRTYLVNGDYKPDNQFYGLSYRYQNPTNWMAKNGEFWTAPASQTWGISTAKYNNVTGVVPTLKTDLPDSFTLMTDPVFETPTIGEKGDTEYYFSYEVNEDLTKRYVDVFIRNLDVRIGEETDFLIKGDYNTMFKQDDNIAFISKVTYDPSKVPAGVTISGVNKIMTHYNLTHQTDEWGGKDDELNMPTSTDEWIARITMPYRSTEDPDNVTANFNDLYGALEAMDIRIAYAYYFSAGFGGDKGENFTTPDESHSQSCYVGFDNDNADRFPSIRYDHSDTDFNNDHPNANMIIARRANETSSGLDETLTAGDNAFLLVPEYTEIKLGGEKVSGGQLTGIKDVEGNVLANIITGKGFIDLNGNAGMIFTADGRTVYNGNNRANLPQGVYVVTLKNRSVKVLVK